MDITQERIDFAISQIENQLESIGLKDDSSFLYMIESNNEHEKIFIFEISNLRFKTIIKVFYDFLKEEVFNSSDKSFSWMDYKKITE